MMDKKNHACAFGLLFSALFLILSVPTILHAGTALVSGQYLSATGQDIQLRITVASPAPGTLIVIQNLPAGTPIAAASPPFNQYDAGRGEVKWLLTHVGPGGYTVSLHLARPLAAGQIAGEIRYKDPVTGRLTNLPVRP